MRYIKGPIPLYFQLYLKLKQEITMGDRLPGSRIPSIQELNQESGISHGMVRKALDLLEMEGLIVKKARIGTIVQDSPRRVLWIPTSSLQDIRDRFFVENVLPISADWVDTPNRVLAVLTNRENVLKNNRIYKLHFLLVSKEDDRRRNLSDLFLPAWRYDEVSPDDLRREPIITVSNNLNIVKMRQIVRPWFCDSYASQHLLIPEGTPIFHRTLIPYLADGRPLAVFEQLATVYAFERDIDIN
jgi:GntR family transcriptional regulator